MQSGYELRNILFWGKGLRSLGFSYKNIQMSALTETLNMKL